VLPPLIIGDVSEYNDSFAMLTPMAFPSSYKEEEVVEGRVILARLCKDEEEDEGDNEEVVEEEGSSVGLHASTRRTVPVRLLPPPLCKIGG
jgi:hypothetical protein